MVPYERNQYFTGRDAFLKRLFCRFRDPSPAPYHGRLALYGMGGIGKTQAALEFIYRYQSYYSRIYWISAVSQESLLDGYGKIAKQSEIKMPNDFTPIEIADRVLSWLRENQSWLLVIDNLDDINILSTRNLGVENNVQILLPQCGPQQHTLITTRNPRADDIPAQGVEVPVFDKTEALELLISLSKNSPLPNSSENETADQIVEELGHLPLAIGQAAAYIKQVSGNFTRFLRHYREYRPRVNSWMPQGPRPYPHSVATTWAMSFNAVFTTHHTAAELFRLLAFFNPDGILIDFLRTGVSAMRDDLRQLVSQETELLDALLRLETFSLLKWNRLNETLVVHRLVQAVVKDEMPDPDLTSFKIMIVDICDQAFPQEWNEKTWALCRLYVGQVMGPLMDAGVSEAEKFTNVVDRVGWFLRDDGKAIDSERLLVRSLEKRRRILGAEHPDTLMSMNNLASTYWAQGKTAEAAALQEEVLEKRKRILGAEHPHTLTSMNNL